MRKTSAFTRAAGVAVAVLAALGISRFTPLLKAQSMGPSARAAVRLKYHPPDNWIKHYLGDDRYKVAGNIWRVVSTQNSNFYHRANCPAMLRESPDIVIGFANAKEAKEAGYEADPLCAPDASIVTYAGNASAMSADETINLSDRAMLIVLADGASTVMLPARWRRSRSGAETILGHSVLSDTLQPLKGAGSLRFAFINAPANINAEPFLKPDKFPGLVKQVNGQGEQALKNAAVSNGTLGGRPGVTLTPSKTTPTDAIKGRVTVMAIQSKVYILENNARDNDAASIIKSFQPR